MSEDAWKDVWRHWLRARFGERLGAEALEEAVADAEPMRRFGKPLAAPPQAAPPLDNGEMPFANPLPPIEEPEP